MFQKDILFLHSHTKMVPLQLSASNIAITAAIVFLCLLLCLAGIGIKILVRRRGEFKRSCTSIDPYSGESAGCQCGKMLGEHTDHQGKDKAPACAERSKHPYQPLEVNKEFLKEL